MEFCPPKREGPLLEIYVLYFEIDSFAEPETAGIEEQNESFHCPAREAVGVATLESVGRLDYPMDLLERVDVRFVGLLPQVRDALGRVVWKLAHAHKIVEEASGETEIGVLSLPERPHNWQQAGFRRRLSCAQARYLRICLSMDMDSNHHLSQSSLLRYHVLWDRLGLPVLNAEVFILFRFRTLV